MALNFASCMNSEKHTGFRRDFRKFHTISFPSCCSLVSVSGEICTFQKPTAVNYPMSFTPFQHFTVQ